MASRNALCALLTGESTRLFSCLTEMSAARREIAEADLDDPTKCSGRCSLDLRYTIRQCQYGIDDLQRGVELAIREPHERDRAGELWLLSRVAIDSADQLFELRRQRRGLTNADVVGIQ